MTGRVVNEEGEPLVGVNVLVKGTTQGTSTDIDGIYSIAVADDDVLQFTYLGYGSAEWRVGTQTRIDVVLKEDKQMLDEVVVVGYGTVKRRDLVGAVDQVDSKVFSERSNPSISRWLQGDQIGRRGRNESHLQRQFFASRAHGQATAGNRRLRMDDRLYKRMERLLQRTESAAILHQQHRPLFR